MYTSTYLYENVFVVITVVCNSDDVARTHAIPPAIFIQLHTHKQKYI